MLGTAEPPLRPLTAALAERAAAVRAAIDPDRLRRLVEILPAPRVRPLRPDAMAAVDSLVLEAFGRPGWRAALRPFEWRSRATPGDRFRGADGGASITVIPGVNVVAVKDGETSDAVVVVAHHDTVTRTGGADDNGSGIVALMELARLLGPVPLRRSLVLAAVDHEELGFLGARQLVRELSGERPVVGAFVLEMLAYTDSTPGSQRLPGGIGAVYRQQVRKVGARGFRGDFIAVLYEKSARRLATSFAEHLNYLAGPSATVLLRAPTDLPALGWLLERTVPFVRDFARSDHVAFWETGIPAVQITDTANFRNPHYHEPSDLPDTLDYGRLADVVAAVAVAVERVAGR